MSDVPERRAERRVSAQVLESRRQIVMDRLTEAFSQDLITMDDYERRCASAQASDSLATLEDLAADLPISEAPRNGARPYAAAPSRAATPYAGAGMPQTSLSCVMSDRSVSGDWLRGDSAQSFTLMGETRIDFRDATLPESGPVRLSVFTLMGETQVIVPPGLPVVCNAFPFMGEAALKRDVERRVPREGPWIEIQGFIMMGSLVVKNG